jgi:hypothetical protein
MACRTCWRGEAKLRDRLEAAMKGKDDPLQSLLGRLSGDDLSIIHDLRACSSIA